MGRSEALQIAANPPAERCLQGNADHRALRASEDEPNPEGLSEYGYSDAFKKPFDIALLAERIRTLVEEKRENM